MSITHIALAWPIAAVVFLALDAVWLTAMADRLYRPAIGHLMTERFLMAPAALFYVIYISGIVLFAIAPALQSRRPLTALLLGAALGLLAYATYDLTNQATLKGWPWHVTVADLCWGAFVTGMAAWAATHGSLWVGGLLGKN